MARKKVKANEEPHDPWEYYESIQLTPEQKAAARRKLEKKAEEAARSGAYAGLLRLFGKVHLTYDIEELREDRD